jgi:hypothetical protein
MATPVLRKYFVLTEIIDILTQTCQPFINDEDIADLSGAYFAISGKNGRYH